LDDLRWITLVLLAACASPAPPRETVAAPPPVVATHAPSPSAPSWLVGDLHMHVSPPDDADDVRLGVDEIATRAVSGGLDFVILTPHLSQGAWADDGRRRRFLSRWTKMAGRARTHTDVTLIPGAELSVPRVGHFGLSGVDFSSLSGRDVLAAADRAGAFVVVNHPFAVPTRLPGIRASHWDMSYKPWSRADERVDPLDGAEIWNVPLSLANIVSQPGGQSAEAHTLAAADAFARQHRRPVTLVGGSDNHSIFVLPTTWVRAERNEASILAALAAGATCVGGADAGDLEARGDGEWVGIGGHLRGARVELRFAGQARVFVDGEDRGEHVGGFSHAGDTAPHTYRIVKGPSRSGFVYANL
jgi:hypothetical protein